MSELEVRTRDAYGRWKRGVSGNPKGRLPRQTENEYLNILMEKCTPDRWADIIEKALRQAVDGDARARDWLSRYVVGDPIQVHEYLFDKHEDICIRVIFDGGPGMRPRLDGPGDEGKVIEGEAVTLEAGDDA